MKSKDTTESTKISRRRFITGQWFPEEKEEEDCSESSSDSDTVSEGTEDSINQPTPSSTVIHHAFRMLLIAGLLIGIIITGMVTIGVATPDDPSSEDALNEKEHAVSLLNELQTLDSTPETDIDRGVLQSVESRIEQGNLSYRSGDYAQAIEHYDTAIDQARASLERGYQTRTDLLLTGVENHLSELDEHGYNTPLMARLDARLVEVEEQHETVSGLQEARGLHSDAEELNNDLGRLPSADTVQWANRFQSGLIVVALMLALLLGVPIGAYLHKKWLGWRKSNETGPAPITGGNR